MLFELDSKFVGAPSRAHVVEVTPRRMMNYAAGVGDTNPRYYDDEVAEGIAAHPMLGLSLTWPLCEFFADFWELEDFPYHVFAQQVHFNDVLEHKRPIRAGDVLTITGEVANIVPHPAGTNMGVKLVARDASGEEVFSEYSNGILRGVKCVGGKRGSENIPEMASVRGNGPPLWEVKQRIDPLAAYIYDGCSSIYFPIHTSMKTAHAVGLPRPIYHGAATLSKAVSEIVMREADGNPTKVLRVGGVFTAMVLPGDDIVIRLCARHENDEGSQVYFDVENAEGKRAISRGQVLIQP